MFYFLPGVTNYKLLGEAVLVQIPLKETLQRPEKGKLLIELVVEKEGGEGTLEGGREWVDSTLDRCKQTLSEQVIMNDFHTLLIL